MRILSIICVFVALSLGGVGTSVATATNDRDDEVATLITDLQSPSFKKRTDAAKVITRSGFTSPKLYSTLEKLLQGGYPLSKGSSHTDEMSWYCKALASSGDYKYSNLLTEVSEKAPSAKLKKYAKQSLKLIDDYASRRDAINSTALWDESLTPEENRYINMLKSDNDALTKDAAKLIYRGNTVNKAVYTVVDEEIHEMLPAVAKNRGKADTVAWLCKALATSGEAKYRTTLEKVISTTNNGSLKNHARKALGQL